MVSRIILISILASVPYVAQAAAYNINQAPQVTSERGWYVGALGGVGFISDITDIDADGDVNRLHFNEPAWQAGLQVGYECETLRLELQYAHFNGEVDQVTENNVTTLSNGLNLATGITFGANINVDAVMLNVLFDMSAMTSTFIPYIGAGAGYANIEADVIAAGNGVTYGLSAASDEFAYQGIVGLTMPVNSSVYLFVDYRYFATSNVNALSERYQNHTINLGVNFRFDGERLS